MAKLFPALEDNVKGVSEIEREFVIYAELLDKSQLNKSSQLLEQEQWNLFIPKTEKNAAQGGVRIRKETTNGVTNYLLTTKVKVGDDKQECTVPTTEDNFKQFKLLADDGMVKNRFTFPIEGTDLKWEVDMFLKPNGEYHDWCKIDLEVTDKDMELPPLPMNFGRVILPPEFRDPHQNTDDEAKIKELWDTCFRSENEFAKKGLAVK